MDCGVNNSWHTSLISISTSEGNCSKPKASAGRSSRHPPVRGRYPRQIEATDEEIDALVYELYGLTEEEIAIVEGQDHRTH